MARGCSIVLAAVAALLCTPLIAKDRVDPNHHDEAYVIELGVVSYDRGLPVNAIKAFQKELEAHGGEVPSNHGDLTTLAYQQMAQEITRVSLTFVLRVGDLSLQNIKAPDSSISAQVKLFSANDSTLQVGIESQFAGKVISRHGVASMTSSRRRQEIPLDDREHYSGSVGTFALFPNGAGQGDTRRSYLRARRAAAGDLELKRLKRDHQLLPEIAAKLEANPPRFLAFDERWQWLKLVTPAEYDDYATLDKLEEILKDKMSHEIERITQVCNLRNEQAEKLQAALLRHRAEIQRDAYNLEETALRNPRLQGDEAREFRGRLAEINELLHQSYATQGSLTAAILRTHLTDEQLERLERATLNEFVTALAGSGLTWEREQTREIRSFLERLVDESRSAVLDHQLLLDALNDEFMSKVLDERQIQQFERLLRASPKAHYFILNATKR